jgi:tetratricopeptide (TPR) repeat protein
MKNKITLVLLACLAFLMVGCLRPGERQLVKGNEYFDKGRWSEAITEYTEAIEKSTGTENNPVLLTAYTNRAESYFFLNKVDEAIADSTKAIEVDPLSVIPYLNRSKYYIYNDEFDKAIADCDKVLELGLESPITYYNRAVANSKKGNYDAAIDDFNKALEISSDEILNQRIKDYLAQIEKQRE